MLEPFVYIGNDNKSTQIRTCIQIWTTTLDMFFGKFGVKIYRLKIIYVFMSVYVCVCVYTGSSPDLFDRFY